MPFNLPDSAVEFLKSGKQFDYDYSKCEARRVGLKRLDQLTLSELRVSTEETDANLDNPHAGEFGFYVVPAVSLTGECESYSPEFILLWLPEDRLFGAWDCDHLVLTAFPSARWEDIIADPLPYLNAQWYPGSGVGTTFRPWPKYEFRLYKD